MDIMKELQKPFESHEIEWRIQSFGESNGKIWARVIAYINARAVMDRLDNVFGVFGWTDEYRLDSDGAVTCKLSVCYDDKWVSKEDAAEATDVEPIKGGRSGALKRAAVKFGIGRYLYKLTDNFAIISNQGRHYQPANSKKGTQSFKWNPPMLPSWALPDNVKQVFEGEEIKQTSIDELKAKLEKYLAEYESDNNKKAVDYIKSALTSIDYETVYGALYTIEEKRGGKR